ncbi:hypothetical protein PAPYR_637 [Paratrimastix pyriformis]|uniref:Uncharacterized protein n=1 Tax=Paratrimastix pyriformis TaxID=342808 RepID=A0ABQ8UU41_9EUKA|nr:hypothetical protein PAPYR_637 [Paratrimastix pyriformis]
MEAALPVSLEQLPDDMLLAIINEVLTPLERREKMAINLGGFFALYATNSRLHQLTALFRDLVKERKDAWLDYSVNSLFRVATCFTDICLDDTGITNSCLDFLVHKVPGLRSLSLRRCTKLTPLCMTSICRFAHLEHLDITDCHLSMTIHPRGRVATGDLHTLTSLCCSGNVLEDIPLRLIHLEASGVTDELVQRLPSLKSLSLHGRLGGYREPLLKRFYQLDSLRLDPSFGGVAAAMLQDVNPNLRVLHTTFTLGHDGKTLPWARFRKLEDLDLCETVFQTPVSLAHPTVRRLGLTLTPATCDMLRSALARCPCLARLDWHTRPDYWTVPPSGLPGFLRDCDPLGLTSLTLNLRTAAMHHRQLEAFMAGDPFRAAPHLLRLRMVGLPGLGLAEEALRLLAAACPNLEVLVTENLMLSPAGLCAACDGWPRLRTLVTQSGTSEEPLDLAAVGAHLAGLRTLALTRSFVRPENLCGFLRGAAALQHLALDQCRCPGYEDGAPAPALVTDGTLDLLASMTRSRLQTLALADSFGGAPTPNPAASPTPVASPGPAASSSPQEAPLLSPPPVSDESSSPLPPPTPPPEGPLGCAPDPLTEPGWCDLIARGLMLRALWVRGCPCFGRAALEAVKTRRGPCLRTVGFRGIGLKSDEVSGAMRGVRLILRHSEPTPAERWTREVEAERPDQLGLLWQSKFRKWLGLGS